MLKNYFKIAIRNLIKQKQYSIINILGLSVGFACTVIVFLFIRNEISYDDFHQNKDEIFRIVKHRENEQNSVKSAWSQVPMGPAIEDHFAAAEKVIRFWDAFNPLVGNGSDFFNEDGSLYFTDPEVFEVFSFGLVQGNPKTVLTQPGSVVLTKAAAAKYFGDENPVGKSLSYDGFPADQMEMTVTGIMNDLPANSQFSFNMLVTLNGVDTEEGNWGSHKSIWTYVQLQDPSQKSALEQQLTEFLNDQYQSSLPVVQTELEPLEDVYLHSEYSGGFKAGNTVDQLYLFGIIGFLILAIACINFINLATARSIKRAREVGVRKTFGAIRSQILYQFIGETFVMVIIAMALSLFLTELFLPVFNSLSGSELELSALLTNPYTLPVSLIFALLISLIAGLYPAIVLSGFKPALVFKKMSVSSYRGISMRKALVVFQFAVSITLIAATIIVKEQLTFIQSKSLGFQKESILVIPYTDNEQAFIDRLQQKPQISGFAITQRVPVNTKNSDGRTIQFPDLEEPMRVESYIIDGNFIDTYDIKLMAGRGISDQIASDTSGFVVNMALIKEFGWSDPEEAIGHPMTWSGNIHGEIVGVVQDFHMNSFHEKIEPLVMLVRPQWTYWKTFISIRINAGADYAEVLPFIEQTWKELTPAGAYDYFFVDESLAQLHQKDQQLGYTFEYVSALAIFIACLGLLGLISFMANQRTKEIATRKVLGASVRNIIQLLSKDFLKLVLIGSFIAVPVSLYMMTQWLNNFAYHTSVKPIIYVLATVITLLIASMAVSWQSYKAATANPVDSLKNE